MDKKIYIAQPVGKQYIPILEIKGHEYMPEQTDMGNAQAVFCEQAKIIADALYESLPGGTLHALLVEFLRRKTSLLVVNY